MSTAAELIVCRGYEIVYYSERDAFFRTLAMPTDARAYEDGAIELLVREFYSRGRQPKVEFFAEAFPQLDAALYRQGWRDEHRAPAFWLQRPGKQPIRSRVLHFHAQFPRTRLRDYLVEMAKAYDWTSEIAESEVSSLIAGLSEGKIRVAAVELDGKFGAGATLSIYRDTAELQGVWTRKEFRRRGLALDACNALIQCYLGPAGRMIWLSAGGEDSRDLYVQLGFKPMGTQINMCLS